MRISQHAACRAVDIGVAAVQIGDEDAIGRPIEQLALLLLTVPQRRFRNLPRDQGADPGAQLLDGKRLDQVVLDSLAQHFHAQRVVALCCEDHDRAVIQIGMGANRTH